MSSYLTNADFAAQSPQLFAQFTGAQITQSITWASTMADSYLRKRYALPLLSFDVDLTSAVAVLAKYWLLVIQGFRPGSGQNEILIKQYDDTIKWFTQVSQGLLQINAVDSSGGAVDEEGSLTDSSPKVNWKITTGPRRCDDFDEG